MKAPKRMVHMPKKPVVQAAPAVETPKPINVDDEVHAVVSAIDPDAVVADDLKKNLETSSEEVGSEVEAEEPVKPVVRKVTPRRTVSSRKPARN